MSSKRARSERAKERAFARLPPLPPGRRSRAALGLTAHAAAGRFALQVCRSCGATQYPPQECCRACLGSVLDWRPQDGAAQLLATTTLHHSHDPYFRARLPWRIGTARLDAGPSVIVHVPERCPPAGSRIRVGARLDKSGRGVLVALPPEEVPQMSDDRVLGEMSCEVRGRRALVCDGASPLGQALVRALVAAGAAEVWAGNAARGSKAEVRRRLAALKRASAVALDVTSERSVHGLARRLGGKVDILINNTELQRGRGSAAGDILADARAEMDVNYFGLLRLAREFAPPMQKRASSGRPGALAWVNLLSVLALGSPSGEPTFGASKAAALAFAQALRAKMRPAGIRVINVFPGPGEAVPGADGATPAQRPAGLARAIVDALGEGIEDVYPDPVAQEWLQRWQESPKLLELELDA